LRWRGTGFKKIEYLPLEERKGIIDMGESFNIISQCELTGIPRSSYYYKHRPESHLNLELMRMIDEQYMKTPFYGIPRMTAFLRSKGYNVNLSHPDHVWCPDITRIRMKRGFVYLTVVMDWYSRYVLSWKLSIFTSILLSHEILISMDENNRYHSALDYKTPREIYFNGKRSLKAGMDK